MKHLVKKIFIVLVFLFGLSLSTFAKENRELKSINEWFGSEDFNSLSEEAKVADSFLLTARCLSLTSVHLSILNLKDNSNMKKNEIKKLKKSLTERMETLTLLGKVIFQDKFNYKKDDDFEDQYVAYTYSITEIFSQPYMELALNTLDQSNNILDNYLLSSDDAVCNILANTMNQQ